MGRKMMFVIPKVFRALRSKSKKEKSHIRIYSSQKRKVIVIIRAFHSLIEVIPRPFTPVEEVFSAPLRPIGFDSLAGEIARMEKHLQIFTVFKTTILIYILF